MLAALPPSLAAQSVTLTGRLFRIRGTDTTAVAGQIVVVHSISERAQGPVDSNATDAAGRFRFTVARPDSGAVFVVSTRYQTIGYFSEPRQGENASEPLLLAVFDTATAGPPMRVGIRHLVVTRGDRGQKRILDIYQVVNPGPVTRVGADSLAAVWSTPLPDGATTPQAGESEVPANAIRFADGRAIVSAPFPPGIKQVVFTYDLPTGARALTVPIEQPTERLEILLEDSTATVSGELSAADPVAIEGRTFRRFSADSVAAGSTPAITFGAGPADARRFIWIAVGVVVVALGGGAVFALRRRPGANPDAETAASPSAPLEAAVAELVHESDERLVAQIAALDQKFEGREASTDPDTWRSYRQRRAALKTELERRVARA